MIQKEREKEEAIMITQRKEREILINSLRQLWEYSNNTCYYSVFRQQKRAQMVYKISYYLEGNKELFYINEEYILNSFIRKIAAVMVERTADNKKAVNRQLEVLEDFNKKKGGNL